MTIDTQKLRQAAASVRAFLNPEYGREISAAADIIDALEGQVAEYARMLEKQSAEADARIDAQAAEIARLREALLWNAAALQESCRATVPITEGDLFFVGADARTAAEILNAADAALAQEQGGSDGS